MNRVSSYIKALDRQASLYEWYARQHGLQRKSMQIAFWILNYPKMYGEAITQNILLEKTYSSKQVVNAMVKKWQKLGYVELLPDPSDRRCKRITYTKEGYEFFQPIYEKLHRLEVNAVEVLSPEEEALLTKLTGRYTDALVKQLKEVKNDNVSRSN